jgi:hypothetical protein
MRTLLTVALCASLLSGCAINVKRKGHGLLCAGLCVHTESDTSMKKGGLPEKPAPEATEEPDKG